MIKQESIDEVRSRMDIYEVVSKHVQLKKNGNSWLGLCPFHKEKTPSFRVTPSKQIYKCFGCGEGGDAIAFIMKHEKQGFIEAIQTIAGQYNITLEEDKTAPQETEEKKSARAEQLGLVAYAQKQYEAMLASLPDDAPALQYMQQRGYTRERMQSWSMGFAPDDWKFLTTPIINMGKHTPATDCGLISAKEGKTWDFYRNRITIPIHDHNGRLAGIAARYIPSGNDDEDKSQAKYYNPCESLVYSKKKIWYGLWQAAKAIKDAGFAYIVEGYFDVQSMHDSDMCNTIASSGTEIDEYQIKMLKRYTDHVVICYDGDQPGVKKAMLHINQFLKMDFKVGLIILPNNQDPDEFIRNYHLLNQQQ